MLNNFLNKSSVTVKLTLVFTLIIVSVSGVFLGARAAMAASLKNISVVKSDVIKINDLFDGVTHNAEYVIGPAPQPGQDMVLNARTLYRIAISLDLPWRPTTSGESITVRREATVVPFEDIESTIHDKLSSEVSGNFTMSLNNGKPEIILPGEMANTVEVDSFSYNAQRNVFHVSVVAPSKENPLKKLNLVGSVERSVEIPVLRNPLRNGDIISKNDLDWINVPEKKLQHNTVMRESDLVGMTPRRISHANKALLSNELEQPQLVDRGENVLITFKNGPLVLTTKGKALQSGAKGDIIRVTNLNSHRTVNASVTSENQVVVQ